MSTNMQDSAVRRRRRASGRPLREKTPDPNAIATSSNRRYSEDDGSSQVEAATASEDAAQAQHIRMQIRPPGTMSAHESKILRRRDKTIASTAARSQSQPREAERLSNPEVSDLLRTTVKRSLSSPRHKDESSEGEVNAMQRQVIKQPNQSHSKPQQTIADENLSRLEQNLRRFEDERKRFEADKRNFEREKREHKIRYKQMLDNEERKRLLQNYRKLSDRIQLPTDADERVRLVHSLRLQRHEAPMPRSRNRSSGYDESSTQFSSSDADVDEITAARMLKHLSPVRRHAQNATNGRGTAPEPPKPPERQSVSRNNSLSPIRPQRRSRTPEQRTEMIKKLTAVSEVPRAQTEVPRAQTEVPKSSTKQAAIPIVATVVSTSVADAATSLTTRPITKPSTKTDNQQFNNHKVPLEPISSTLRRRRSLETPITPSMDTDADEPSTPLPSLVASPPKTDKDSFIQRFLSIFKKQPSDHLKKADTDTVTIPQIAGTASEADTKETLGKNVMQLLLEARSHWLQLKADYPQQVESIRCMRNKCICHTMALIMLCGFGGLMFRYIEGSAENIYKCEVRKVKRDFIDNLWTVSHNMREDDWKTLARQKLRKFEEELHSLRELGLRYFPGQRSWNFVNCVLYCVTVVTTIGYGHITPKTVLGQSLTIVYAIIGIPIFLIVLADFGKLFTRCMKFIWAYVRRLYYTGTCRKIRKQQQYRDAMSGFNTMYDMAIRRPSQYFNAAPEEDIESHISEPGKSVTASHIETPTSPYPETFEVDDEFNLPVSLASILLISYILIGAFVYTIWEDWTYFEAFYFVFISMSTIGFGDLVPNHPIFMMCSIIYLIFGLALTSMFINVVQIKLSDTFKQASAKLGATIGLGLASEAADEAGSTLKTPSELASIHGSRLDKITEDDADVIPIQPTSILRPTPQPAFVATQNENATLPPPLLPRRQVSIEEKPEAEKKKKKRFF